MITMSVPFANLKFQLSASQPLLPTFVPKSDDFATRLESLGARLVRR